MSDAKDAKAPKQPKPAERKGSERDTKLINFHIAGTGINWQKVFADLFAGAVTSAVDNTGVIQIGCPDKVTRKQVSEKFLDILRSRGNQGALRYADDERSFYIIGRPIFLAAMNDLVKKANEQKEETEQARERKDTIQDEEEPTFARESNGKHMLSATPPPPPSPERRSQRRQQPQRPPFDPRQSPPSPPPIDLANNHDNHNHERKKEVGRRKG